MSYQMMLADENYCCCCHMRDETQNKRNMQLTPKDKKKKK